MDLIIPKVAFEAIAIGKGIIARATHHIVSPLALVTVTGSPHFGAIAVLLTLAPAAGIAIPVGPVKGTLTVPYIVVEHALVAIAIGPLKSTPTVLRAFLPLA